MPRFRLAACAIAAALTATPVFAQDFYRDRTINVVVGLSTGGGYDLYGRTLARHLGKHIPGNPRLVVQNMPGAGSLTSVLWLENVAPRDGTTMLIFNHGLIGDSVLSPEKVRVDFRRFAWLGSIAEDISACYMWHTKGPKNLAEVKAYGRINFGQTGAGSSSDIAQRILKNILGVNINEVHGYPGSAELRLAVERGETDGDCGAWAVLPEEWLKEKKIYPFIKNTPNFGPYMSRDVPYVVDVMPGPREREIAKLLTTSTQVSRPFIVHRDTPPERLKILRDAFAAMTKDPEFKADIERQRLTLEPRFEADSLAIVSAITGASPDIIAGAKKVMTD
jgi:tripartite-type tricarboxylate transporter receptor subunit TctC